MNTCYIFGAAQGLPKSFSPAKGDLVMAADAGYATLEHLGVTPDITVGDFDSMTSVPDNSRIVRHPVRKDDTDSLLAVRIGLEQGFTRFVLYGCTGGRLDHTLANLQVLSFLAEKGTLGFLCGNGYTAAAVKNGFLDFKREALGKLSVFSAGTVCTGVTLTGLSYPLNKATVTHTFPIGVSNEFTGKESRVAVETGTLLVLWDGDPTLVCSGEAE